MPAQIKNTNKRPNRQQDCFMRAFHPQWALFAIKTFITDWSSKLTGIKKEEMVHMGGTPSDGGEKRWRGKKDTQREDDRSVWEGRRRKKHPEVIVIPRITHNSPGYLNTSEREQRIVSSRKYWHDFRWISRGLAPKCCITKCAKKWLHLHTRIKKGLITGVDGFYRQNKTKKNTHSLLKYITFS